MHCKAVFLVSWVVISVSSQASDLRLDCRGSDGATFVIDEFEKDPCRVTRIEQGRAEVQGGIAFCLYPDEVHSDYSFWTFDRVRNRAELLGELIGDEGGRSFSGFLNYTTPDARSVRVELDCQR